LWLVKHALSPLLRQSLATTRRTGCLETASHFVPGQLKLLLVRLDVLGHWPVRSLIHSRGRTLRVIGRRDDDADQPPVLVVEDG
jgi:hypothetical protein